MPEHLPASDSHGTPTTGQRTWRVTSELYVPMATPVSGVGLPAQLTFVGRITPGTVAYPTFTAAVRPAVTHEGQPPLPPGWERLRLIADVSSTSPVEAIKAVAVHFGSILDSWTFDLGAPIGVGQLEVLDITRPVTIGQDREMQIFSAPPFDRYARSVEMQAISGAVATSLPASLPDNNSKVAAALRWFNKALATDVLFDQFIFLWIALEILCDLSLTSVQNTYVAACGHEIANCPECGRSTSKEVRGPTIKSFLQDSFQVDERTANELWRMRQVMHGAVRFDSSRVSDLPRLVQPLRAAVASGLKNKLGKTSAEPPVITSSGLSINPAAALGGARQISEEDIRSLNDI